MTGQSTLSTTPSDLISTAGSEYLSNFTDFTDPGQIDYRSWHQQFKKIPDHYLEQIRYYRQFPEAPWSQYLFPPSTHAVYGHRLLRKLQYDNSLAALRLWGFMLSEGERIFRARQAGLKVVAVMGDLGAMTPLIYSFPNVVAFYPDCLWWTPFLMESKVLFEEAAELGLGEDCCFVRAALGGFSKIGAYFPKPDLCLGTVGATCDDMAAVMSEVSFLGYDIHYFELPHRSDRVEDRAGLIEFLSGQYRETGRILEQISGSKFNPQAFQETIGKVNHLRSAIAEIKRLVSQGRLNPLGGLEMLNLEFAALSYYGDLDECLTVVEDLLLTVRRRVEQDAGYADQDLRLVWVTPPADPILINYVEKLGGRIVGSEYVINQTTPHFNLTDDPFQALAQAQLSGSLMGTSAFRTELVLQQVEQADAEGVIISGIFGSTHCPYETWHIMEALRQRQIPVISFDVAAPGKLRTQSQLFNRLEAFMESLRARRRVHAR